MGKNRWSQGREFQRRAWRHQRRSCRNIDGSRNRFRLRRWSGKSISHNVLDARNVHYRAVELSQVGRADQGRETLNKASVKGFWSVKIVNSLPSRRKQKCWREEQVKCSSLLKAKYFCSASDNFLEKKARNHPGTTA